MLAGATTVIIDKRGKPFEAGKASVLIFLNPLFQKGRLKSE
jgi:hypothetical protein